ncbi:MAG: hypothetical protein ACLGH0_06410 [Thermoanaerobaculia bacterium]
MARQSAFAGTLQQTTWENQLAYQHICAYYTYFGLRLPSMCSSL